MKELDKLKQHWKSSEESYPHFSEKEIYVMLHKRSSSVVKWILIISILEFAFWTLISFLMKDGQNARRIDEMGVSYIITPMTILSYGIILYFVGVFYMNYRKIKVTDNAKKLMKSILRTRRAVSNYILVNLAYIAVSAIIIFILFFKYDPALINALEASEAHGDAMKFYLIYFGFTFIGLGIFIVIIWLFYKLIYGLLLKRLRRNYDELKKIDF